MKKDKRSTIVVTEDYKEVFEKLKTIGFNFAVVSKNAIDEAIDTGMPIPGRVSTTPAGMTIGVLVSAKNADKLDELTKPLGAKAAYIQEAIKKYAERNNIL